MGIKRERVRGKGSRRMWGEKGPQRKENDWRKRMESMKQGGGVRGSGGREREREGGGRDRMKWVGPPTFIFSIPKKSNFWDIGSKIKTSSTKRLLNLQAQPRIWALQWSSLPCWGWQTLFLEHMASVRFLLSDWSVRGQGKVSLENFILASTFWVRHTKAHVAFCGRRLLDPVVCNIAPKIAFLTAKGEELFSFPRTDNLLYMGFWSWVRFKYDIKT